VVNGQCRDDKRQFGVPVHVVHDRLDSHVQRTGCDGR
jgi:hypothetical protein